MAYRTRISHQAVVRIVGQKMAKAAARRAAVATAGRARNYVIGDGLVNTGRLADSFKAKDITSDPMRPTFRVGSTAPYAHFPENGTQGTPAVPGRVLRFKPKGASVFIFATSTGPVRAYRFMKRARDDIRPRDFKP